MVSTRVKQLGVFVGLLLIIALRSFSELLARLANEPIFGILISIVGASETNIAAFGEVMQWILFAYILYTIIPQIYSSKIKDVTTNIGFKLVTVSHAIGLALILNNLFDQLQGTVTPQDVLAILRLSTLIPVVLLSSYISFIGYNWVITNTKSEFRSLNYRIMDSMTLDIEEEKSKISIMKAGAYITWAAIWILFSLLILAIWKMYPIGEIALLSGILLQRIGFFNRITRRFGHHPEEVLDLEHHIRSTIKSVGHPKGVVSFTSIVAGVSASMAFVLQFRRFDGFSRPISASNPVVYGIIPPNSLMRATYLLVALYGLYYWVITSQRLEAFLRVWETRLHESQDQTTVDQEDGWTRPPGFLLPIPVLVFCANRYVGLESSAYPVEIYLFVWGITVIVIGWTIVRSRTADPQTPFSDQVGIPVAVVMILVGWSLISDFAGLIAPLLIVGHVILFFPR